MNDKVISRYVSLILYILFNSKVVSDNEIVANNEYLTFC